MKLNLFLVLEGIVNVFNTSYSATLVQLMRAYLARTHVVATLAASMTGQSQLANISRSVALTGISEEVTRQQLKALGKNVEQTVDQVKTLLGQSSSNANDLLKLRDDAIRFDQQLQAEIVSAAQN